jgi:hypothetical protein
MISINKKNPAELKETLLRLKLIFERGCKYLLDKVGPKPFHLRGRLNYAVMDSTMYCVFLALEKDIDDFSNRFEGMMRDTAYIESSTINTSDEREVRTRFSIAQDYLLK